MILPKQERSLTMSLYSTKQYLLIILDILKEHSDPEHRLSVEEIVKIAKRDYGLEKFNRHKARPVLTNLYEYYGNNIGCAIHTKSDGSEYLSGWHYISDFTDAEIDILVNSIIFSKYIPYNVCKEMVDKLAKLSSKYYRNRNIQFGNENTTNQLTYCLDILSEAMSTVSGRMPTKVSFKFLRQEASEKPVTSTKNDKTPKVTPPVRIVSPYEVVIANGKYYLICSHSAGNNLFHYRIDLMRDIKNLEDKPIRPIREVSDEYLYGLDLDKYMKEHIYMFGGESMDVTLKIEKTAPFNIVGHVIDWFGSDVHFFDEKEDTVRAKVRVNKQSMKYWALQYGMYVEVETPGLREEIQEAIKVMSKKYK